MRRGWLLLLIALLGWGALSSWQRRTLGRRWRQPRPDRPGARLGPDVGQCARFYYWRARELPIPAREIETSSANMHLIAAADGVRRANKRVRPGQIIHLEGFLVDARRSDGWHWNTSMTRNDTGDGNCELVYVEDLKPVAGQ